ncbi:hypothetical protein FA09DRAFT_335943 [Tilletiopsis washingtonensis]|uniref:Uncharacterized protein n=1 Tax=Tilletiopsis washingtonensis TaxID=58919 RepID=A0A316ZLQ0_9BASI|nr:hypothetical protein FA09DRAFT_335943 [Tilletiopsis washingtonensis]PWO01326.1 hypothetical protein FA09DRAFT_335943 [Tilletiopsis washingtonensis]
MLARSVFVLALVAAVSAQVTPTSSIDPLNGTPFSTPRVVPEQTFTPTTTYESAGSRTPTVVAGSVGPSALTDAYTFSYNAPVSSLTGTGVSNLLSSLAAKGQPTTQGAALAPNPSGLQIVTDAAPARLGTSAGMAMCLGAVVLGAFLV